MKRIGFCEGWKFSRDGGAFESVAIPHDAMLGAYRGPDAPAGSASGYFGGGAYRYRKSFELTREQAAETVLLEFEGVYRDAELFVNGSPAEVPPYGFVPFFADCTGLVREGTNLVEVACENIGQPDCRWYSGAGIHRPVWLWTGGACRILPEGVRVTTLSVGPTAIRVDVDSTGGVPFIRIVDADGTDIAQAQGRHAVFDLPHARLWSADNPHLYRCVVDLHDGPDVVDSASCAFGIRLLEWSPRGLFVNGRETLLRGGCIHCDNGILGAASWREAEFRRIRLLKDAGFNAVRVAHNPAPAALLDACDEVGMYVMDETWDMWFTRKSAHDYARHFLDWCDHDLHRLASRDYNHPSVIMYSIGNEVADPILKEGVELERSLVDCLHSLDPTRPVTCGLNLTMMVMEKAGSSWYDNEGGVADTVTESGAPRGSMLFNLVAQASGTGMTLLANAHAALAAAVWRTAEKPAIMVRPVNRMSGRTYKATWRGSDAVPSWSWAGCEGTVAHVEVYDGRAHAIRLELNGEVVAERRVHDFVAKFKVEYQPGTLAAVALDQQGRELARGRLSSAQAPFHIALHPEEKRAPARGIAFVSIRIEGANGIVESNADETLTVQVKGGELLAFGSAQPAPTERFLTGTYTTYRGCAMAIVRRTEPGTAKLTARGETLAPTSAETLFVEGD